MEEDLLMDGKHCSDEKLKEAIRQLYLGEKKSLREVSAELGFSQTTLRKYMKQFDIPTRSKRIVDIPKNVLEDLYISQEKTTAEISNLLGYSTTVIVRKLHEYGIPTRVKRVPDTITKEYLYEEYVVKGRCSSDIAAEHGVAKKAILDRLHAWEIPVRQRPNASGLVFDDDIFRHMYIDERKSLDEMAEHFSCSKHSIASYAKENGYRKMRNDKADSEVRDLIEAGKNYSEISRELNMPYSQVKKRCENMGIIPVRPVFPEWDAKEAARMYKEDRMPLFDIMAYFHVGHPIVKQALEEYDVKIRPRETQIDSELLYKRYVEDKASYAELTSEFNISQITLNRVLRRAGIALNRDVSHPEEWNDECFEGFLNRWIEERTGEKADILELADYFDVTPTSVRRKIKSHGLESLAAYNRSSAEYAWQQWLEEEKITYTPNTRKVIPPWELDIYIPEYKVGIEINPSATHNADINIFSEFADGKTTTYHQNKSKMAEAAGIRLIHVFEWYEEEKLKDIVLGLCQRNSKIYARKTKIIRLEDENEEKRFFEKNHLLGYVKSNVSYALIDGNDEIVAAMSFNRPRYGNKEEAEWELLRFANRMGTTVIGGASRLFQHFIRDYTPNSVMSFCNYDMSIGDLYEKLGFRFQRFTAPSYYWVDYKDPSHFYSWYLINSKGVDNVFGTDYGKGASNIDIMLDMGYVRVYNAGNKVYLWINENNN